MRVFLDTEFTSFTDPQLISCGLVAENGAEFYAEITDCWQIEQCSDFVLDVVLPRLGHSPDSTMNRYEAGMKLYSWLSTLDNNITLISDAKVDIQLVVKLMRSVPNCGLTLDPQLLIWPGAAMARHCAILLAKAHSDDTRHHALVDARVLRETVLQTEVDFR